MLRLGKDLDRCYSMRIPFLDGYYKIDIFFNKNNSFLLFGAEQELQNKHALVTLKTYKNIKSSKFIETFLELHNFHSDSLDIVDQYKNINELYINDIQNTINENIVLFKHSDKNNDKIFYDCLVLYGFTFITYPKDFIFLIAERQSISKKLQKKFVRSTAIQIATKKTLELLDQFNEDYFKKEDLGSKILVTDPSKIITLE
jgi:hypothetical protein